MRRLAYLMLILTVAVGIGTLSFDETKASARRDFNLCGWPDSGPPSTAVEVARMESGGMVCVTYSNYCWKPADFYCGPFCGEWVTQYHVYCYT